MQYPDYPQLYEVNRGLLFPTPQGAQEHLDYVRNGKGKTPHPQAFGASVTRR